MIKPTIGRQVWYRPTTGEMGWKHTQPFAATVVHVWSDDVINVVALNELGHALHREHVTLAQDRGAQPGECEWMPFQVGQAKASA